MDPMIILCGVLGVVVGVIIGRFTVRGRLQSLLGELTTVRSDAAESERAVFAERERRAIVEEQVNAGRRDLGLYKDQNDQLRNRLEAEIDQRAKAESDARRVPMLEKLLEGADSTRNALMLENSDLKVQLAEVQTALNKERSLIRERIEDLETVKKQLAATFENTASKLLEEKAERFTKMNDSNMERLLRPFGEEMQNFKKKVEEVYDRESKERFSLGREVQNLINATNRISEDANNLTKALTSNTKVQGDWGEEILERILETCGLTKGREFFVQEHLRDTDGTPLTNEDGSRMRPDVILNYPDERQVIIDSKVSLTDYNRYVAATNDDEANDAIAGHVASIRNHIYELSKRHYQDHAPALDFVMLFVPIEAAYILAMQSEPNLWQSAFSKRILLTSPTNLVVAMKLISDLWKRDAQAKNYEEIVDRGGRLYDKFCLVVESLHELGQSLGRAERSYLDAMNRITDGPGNLMTQVEKLKKLGATAKKALPSSEQVAKSADGLKLAAPKQVAVGPTEADTKIAVDEVTAETRATLFE